MGRAYPEVDKNSKELMLAQGTKLGRYEIRSKIGEGGMGEVYMALDTKLDRKVAVKILPAEVAADRNRMTRFVNEAKAASALNHPNIITIHEIDQMDSGHFIATEFIDGETLRQRMRKAPIKVSEAIDIATQIAGALAAAHAAGIVHRDIKPENVMLRCDGIVKVLDFGLAKLSERPAPGAVDTEAPTRAVVNTEPGIVMGTAIYMSPEQARGLPVDARTDIFSLGVVLYEMVASCLPFQGPTSSDVMVAILNDKEPPPLFRFARDVPHELEHIVGKALRKDQEERYQTVKDMLIDLKDLKRDLEVQVHLERTGSMESSARATHARNERTKTEVRTTSSAEYIVSGLKSHMSAAAVAGVLLVTAVGLLSYFLYFKAKRASALTEKDTILLGDFVNTTGDPVFDVTLKQALAVRLEESPFFQIFSDEGTRETLRYMGRSADERVTKEIAREICLRNNLKALLAGSISNLGSHYVILLEAINARTGDAIAREQVEVESKEKVLVSLANAVTSLREKLGESLSSIQKYDVPIEQATISSLEAFQAFSLGFKAHAGGNSREAIPFYKRAIELDPYSARAHMNLAVVYGNIGQFELAAQSARKAFGLRERASEREKLGILEYYYAYVTGDREKQFEATKLLKQTYPRDWIPRVDAAANYGRFGQYEKGVEEAREGIRLDPNRGLLYSNLASRLIELNRFEEAKKVIEEATARGLGSFHPALHRIAFLQGNREEMQRQVDSSESGLLSQQAAAAASLGQLRRARELANRHIDSEQRRDLKAATAGFASQFALAEVLSGSCQQVRETALRSLAIERERDPLRNAALALALCGEAGQAQSLMEELESRIPDTFVKTIWVPMIRAGIEINQNKPLQAIESLKVAARYELGTQADLLPAYVRGLAYLRARMGLEARAEFQKILDHRGVVGYLPTYPLAHLGLARAAALAGDEAASRKAYEDFFAIWKDADSDVPILRQARQELEKIR